MNDSMISSKKAFVSHKVDIIPGRKAQLEMIGLIVIVVIVLIAIMIYLVYRINSTPQNVKRMYMNRATATNFLITMSKLSVEECPAHTLGGLIIDCAGMKEVVCGVSDSCEMSRSLLRGLLNRTLESYGMSYNLTIKDIEITIGNDGCNSKKPGISAPQILPLNPGQVELTLRICD